jgi:hypothetical protein
MPIVEYPLTEEQLLAGLSTYMERYYANARDPDVIMRTTGTLAAYALASIAGATQMPLEGVEVFIDDFCMALRQLTLTILRDHEREAPV